MKRLFNSSLRVRLLLLVIITVFPALVLTIYTANEQRQLAAAKAQEESLRLLRRASVEYEQLIQDTHQLLAVLAQLPSVREYNQAELNSLFIDLLKQKQSYSSFSLVKSNGDAVYSVPQVLDSVSFNDRSYFQHVLETQDFAIGDYVISRITKNPVLPIAYPILNRSGQIQAILITAIDLRWLNNIAPNVELPPGTTLTVTDRYGTILYRNIEPEKWVGKSASEVPIVQTVLNQKSEGIVESTGVDGIQRYYAFRPLHKAGDFGDIYIYTGIPIETVFAEVNQIFFRNALGLVLAAILMLVIAWIGSNLFFLRYVNKLLFATQGLAAGDMSIRTNVSYEQGELGQLAYAFDNMAETLEQSTDELRNHRDRLEELVQERTKDLRTANGELIALNEEIAATNEKLLTSNKKLAEEITERKQAEDLLRLSEERFLKAFNASPLPMAIIKPGDEQYRYIDVNDSFIRVTGYYREEIMGCTANELNIWAEPEEREKIIKMILEQEALRNLESNIRIKSGGERVVLLSAEIIDLNGEQCILKVINDITERKQLEHEMTRLDRLALVGEMAAGIGHEIRNPMTTVRGFLQVLGGKEECVKYKDFYGLMIEELDRANSIITEFLSLAKNRAVKLKCQNLNTIVRVIYPLIQADALSVDNYVKVELGDIPDLLLDEKEIRQLILNLARNGLEAMTPGGNLIIKTFMNGGEVTLAVQDQGKGIEPDILDKIGTPFFTTKDNGTGLGLAVCYSIAARHNATIKIETCPAGTTFFVLFKL